MQLKYYDYWTAQELTREEAAARQDMTLAEFDEWLQAPVGNSVRRIDPPMPRTVAEMVAAVEEAKSEP